MYTKINSFLCCLFTLYILINPIAINGQNHEIYKESIASLQVVAGNDWLSPPIIMLEGEPIHIDFDDLTHEYHRYTYTIEHCEANWKPSKELFASDYIDGFSEGNTIENMQKSINTKVQYTHYSLQIPNAQCQLKMSGNYRLTVYDENNDNEKILTACFMVVEPLATINMNVMVNTDVDIRNKHQQVNLEVGYNHLKVSNPREQLKMVVMQNGQWDVNRYNIQPQYTMPHGLRWEHNRAFIFQAGNEYRKFEILDITHPTLGVEHISWDGNNFHAYLWADHPRQSYVYDKDANGAFYIRNSDNMENNTTCEYQIVHFLLFAPQQIGDVYIDGVWTNHTLLPSYKLTYNPKNQCYEGAVMLKQGYYSYKYVVVNNKHIVGLVSTEGCFYQTENTYQALLYFRGTGERTDRLVGYQQISYPQ